MKPVVTFGEIMIRFDAPNDLRFSQVIPGALGTSFAGAEANVAVSIACLGGRSRFVTALPDNTFTDVCVGILRRFDIDTRYVHRSPEGRFGAYYVETGANQRPSNVMYDRDGSSFALAAPSFFDWNGIFDDAQWFHFTGITPAVSENAAAATSDAVAAARSRGLTVSCDLNFRKKLWRWRPGTASRDLARETMHDLLGRVDVLIANEEDAADVLGLSAAGSDVHTGVLPLDGYHALARRIATDFPNLRTIATTLRESVSATHNNWGAVLFDVRSDRFVYAPSVGGQYHPYPITAIVDRIGAGDSFAAALIFALMGNEHADPQAAVAFAAAASCLAHSIRGDFNLCTRAEIEVLMAGGGSGRVVR